MARGRGLRAILRAVHALPYTMSGLVAPFGFIVVTGRDGAVKRILDALFGTGPVLNLRSWGGLPAVFSFHSIPLAATIVTPLAETAVTAARGPSRSGAGSSCPTWPVRWSRGR